jgi:hypothetical protein
MMMVSRCRVSVGACINTKYPHSSSGFTQNAAILCSLFRNLRSVIVTSDMAQEHRDITLHRRDQEISENPRVFQTITASIFAIYYPEPARYATEESTQHTKHHKTPMHPICIIFP